jgi:hypothetical protein
MDALLPLLEMQMDGVVLQQQEVGPAVLLLSNG